MVAKSIFALKVAVILALGSTPLAASAGVVMATVGRRLIVPVVLPVEVEKFVLSSPHPSPDPSAATSRRGRAYLSLIIATSHELSADGHDRDSKGAHPLFDSRSCSRWPAAKE